MARGTLPRQDRMPTVRGFGGITAPRLTQQGEAPCAGKFAKTPT